MIAAAESKEKVEAPACFSCRFLDSLSFGDPVSGAATESALYCSCLKSQEFESGFGDYSSENVIRNLAEKCWYVIIQAFQRVKQEGMQPHKAPRKAVEGCEPWWLQVHTRGLTPVNFGGSLLQL